MKELIEQVIQMGNYDLTQLLDTIDRYHIEGRLSDDERMELYMTARKGAEPGLRLQGRDRRAVGGHPGTPEDRRAAGA